MLQPLLLTKIRPPDTHSLWVNRQHLLKRLDDGILHGARLVLIDAPAGSGKSTLAYSWLESRTEPGIWLSLDENDRNEYRLLAYLITALQRKLPGFAEAARYTLPNIESATASLLDPRTQPQLTPMISGLVNTLDEICADHSSRLILCLDDFHHLRQSAAEEVMSFFIEHLPPEVMVILTTRKTPFLPLGRWRASRQFIEFTASDLRFNRQESATFLNELHHLQLSEADLTILEQKSDGWAAGLQLAALALQSAETSQRSRLVRNLRGEDEFFADFFLEEVLANQPADIQCFLLVTSIVESFCVPLCRELLQTAALTDLSNWLQSILPGQTQLSSVLRLEEQIVQTDPAALIDHIRRDHLFLIPLDEEGSWYRYHALFADLLRSRVKKSSLHLTNRLYSTAVHWFEQNGDLSAAMHIARQSGDENMLTLLVKAHWVEMLHLGRIDECMQWLQDLSPRSFDSDPVLSIALAWALALKGFFDNANIQMQHARQRLSAMQTSKMQPQADDENAPRRIQCELALLQVFQERTRGNYDAALASARQAMQLAPAERPLLLGNAYILTGHTCRDMEQIEDAIHAYRKGIPLSWDAGNAVGVLGAFVALVRLYQRQGDLAQAEKVCREGISLAESENISRMPAAATLYLALADLELEKENPEEANRLLVHGLAMGHFNGSLEFIRSSALCQARLYRAAGDEAAAVDVLEDTLSLLHGKCSPFELVQLKAAHAVGLFRTGRLDSAQDWLDRIYPAHFETPSLSHSFEAHCAANLLLADQRGREALALLETFLQMSEEQAAQGVWVETMALYAATQAAMMDTAAAEISLEKARQRGIPLGYRRSVNPERINNPVPSGSKKVTALPVNDMSMQLVDPLTIRENEVLRLAAQGLSNQEIADRLYIEPVTVKKHMSTILKKLGAASRTQAAAIARRAGLLDEDYL